MKKWNKLMHSLNGNMTSSEDDSKSDIESAEEVSVIDFSSMVGAPMIDCQCYTIMPDEDLLIYSESKATHLLEIVYSILNIHEKRCLTNNLKLALKYLILIKNLDLQHNYESEITYFISLILKLRHDFAAYHILGVETTDVSFRSLFDISSDRTPDLIKKDDEFVTIREITVVSDVQRGLFQKGAISGIKKYDREVQELYNKGFAVDYKNIIISAFGENRVEIELEYRLSHVFFDQLINISSILHKYFSDNMTIALSRTNKISKFNDYYPSKLISLSKGYNNNDEIKYSFYAKKSRYILKARKLIPNMLETLDKKPEGNYIINLTKKRLTYEIKEDPNGCQKDKLKNFLIKAIIPGEFTSIIGGELDADYNIFTPERVLSKIKYINEDNTKLLKNINLEIDFDYNGHNPNLTNLVPLPDIPSYSKPLSNWYLNPVNCVGYEELYIEFLCKNIKNIQNKQPLKKYYLASNVLNSDSIDEAVTSYWDKILEINSLDGKIYKSKSAALYPMIKVNNINLMESKLASKLSEHDFGLFTSLILKQISSKEIMKKRVEPTAKSEELFRRLMKAQSDVTSFTMENLDNIFNLEKDLNYMSLYNERTKCQKEYEKYVRETGISRSGGIKYIKIGCNKRSHNYLLWQNEMGHIKVKGSSAIKNGMFLSKSEDEVFNMYHSTINYFNQNSSYSKSEVLNQFLSPESEVLYSLKKFYLSTITPAYEILKIKNIYHMADYISRLCTSLHFFSISSLDRNHIMFDGFAPGSLLIVKGGAKIYKSNKSRWFRLFFPIDMSYSDFIYPEGGSYTKFMCNNELYIATPWINMHESLIIDGMFMLHRLTSFTLCSYLNSYNSIEEIINNLHFHYMMMFHQRRTTEKTLHDLRYLLMNCFSEFSDYKELLTAAAIECKDNIQAYICYSLKNGIKRYYEQCKNFNFSGLTINITSQNKFNAIHPITGVNIYHLSDISFALYTTSLMTIAPVDNLNEQILDIKAVKESFAKFDAEVGSYDIENIYEKTAVTLDNNPNYEDELFKKDFAFDPKLCWLIGRFTGDYIKSKSTTSSLDITLENILNEPFHHIANTSGLRGRYFDNDFFGHKGYYVVYSDMVKLDVEEINQILDSHASDFEKRKKLEVMNVTIIDKYEEMFNEDMIIQMVHKIQKGGPREIYVMNYPTKVKQQILEKFFSKLCTYLQNEMISIPSNKRMHWVHQKVHEYKSEHLKNLNKYYHTYDCRRWAPHSNLLKYFYFISGMSHILPSKFNVIFQHFWDQYLSKKILIRGKLYDSIKDNFDLQDFAKRFKIINLEKKIKKTNQTLTQTQLAYMEMPFSFMMGIFNYLSSLMHAGNQLYVNYLIRQIPMKISPNIFKGEMNLIAHSDDSGGTSYSANYESLISMTFIHELSMKGCNHMLSKKKSSISRSYFEITSILYISDVLIPVLAKFSSLMSISPTDGGYVDDIMTSISKTTEMLTNGATFCQAYLTSKISVDMIRKFYNLPSEAPDYMLPYTALGIPDSHPLMYLLAGSDYEDLKFIYLNKDVYNTSIRFLFALNGNFYNEKLSPHYSYYNKYYRKFEELIDNLNRIPKNDIEKRSMRLVDNSTTIGCLMSFSNLVTQNKFVWSLDYQTRSRRIARAMWFRVSNCIETLWGYTNYKQLRSLISQIVLNVVYNEEVVDIDLMDKIIETTKRPQVIKQIQDFTDMNSKIYTATDDIGVLIKLFNSIKININKAQNTPSSIRPTLINIDIGISPIGSSFNVDNIMLGVFAPRFLPLMKNSFSDTNNIELIKQYLPPEVINDPSLLHKILKSFKQRTNRKFIMYSQIPRGKNILNDYRSIMNLLSYNSFFGKEIKGLQLPISNRLILTGEYYVWGKEMELDNIIYDTYLLLSGFYDNDNVKNGVYEKITNILVRYKDEVSPLSIMLKKFVIIQDKMSLLAKTLLRIMIISFDRLYIDGANMVVKDLEDCAYFMFTQEQKLSKAGWWGEGEIMFFWRETIIRMRLKDDKISSLEISQFNHYINDIISYLDLFLTENKYMRITRCFKTTSTMEKGLVYNIREKCYSYEEGGLGKLYFPMSINSSLKPLSSWAGNNVLKLKNLRKIKIETDDVPNAIYIVPSRFISAIGLSHTFFIETEHNTNIMKELGYKGVALYDFITHKSYNVDFKIDLEDFCKNPQGSEIYKIMYSSGHMPSEYEIDLPGSEGTFMNMLIKYKDENPNYEFNPDNSYLMPMIALGQIYTGTVLSQLYINSKRLWENLTQFQQNKLSKDVKSLITKFRQTKDLKKNDVRELMLLWGPSLPKNALSLYDVDNKEQIFDTLLNIFEYMPTNYSETLYIELHALIFGIFLTPEFKLKSKYFYNYQTQLQWVQTLIDFMVTNSEEFYHNKNIYSLGIFIILKSIFKNKRARDAFNFKTRILTYPGLNVKYSPEDVGKINKLVLYSASRVCTETTGKTIKDRAMSFRRVGTPLGDLIYQNFKIKLNYSFEEFKKQFALKNTSYLEEYNIPTSRAEYTRPFKGFKKFEGEEDEEEEFDDFIDELNMGNDDESFIEENIDKLELVEDKPKNKSEVYSRIEGKKGLSMLGSSISDKIIIILKSPYGKINKNFRNGNIKMGLMPPTTSKLNDLKEIFYIVFYTTDVGINYIKPLNLIDITDIMEKLPLPKHRDFEFVAEGSINAFLDKLRSKLDLDVEIKEDQGEKLKRRLEILGYKTEQYVSLKKDIDTRSMENLISLLLGQVSKYNLSDKFAQISTGILKEEKNRDALERMTVMPEELGALSTSLPPKNKPLISNLKLRAELNSICEGLADNLPSGRFMLSKEMKKTVINISNLVLMDEKHKDFDRLMVLSEIIIGLTGDALEVDDSSNNDNEMVLKMCNIMMDIAQKGSNARRRRIIPSEPNAILGSFLY